MSYAQQKGRVSGSAPPAPPPFRRHEPRTLTEAERQQVAANREFVRRHTPELEPFVKDLHAQGLIDGWRAVDQCELIGGGK
ncbi:MAG: hypothetical protein FWD77_06310 [Betaproteobacteria bacterium]|nr:hypothetical protein [Betaproteobacteria bacterium]